MGAIQNSLNQIMLSSLGVASSIALSPAGQHRVARLNTLKDMKAEIREGKELVAAMKRNEFEPEIADELMASSSERMANAADTLADLEKNPMRRLKWREHAVRDRLLADQAREANDPDNEEPETPELETTPEPEPEATPEPAAAQPGSSDDPLARLRMAMEWSQDVRTAVPQRRSLIEGAKERLKGGTGHGKE